MTKADGSYIKRTVGELLPLAFRPECLNEEDIAVGTTRKPVCITTDQAVHFSGMQGKGCADGQ